MGKKLTTVGKIYQINKNTSNNPLKYYFISDDGLKYNTNDYSGYFSDICFVREEKLNQLGI
jgi:hypothetical protein